MTDVSATCGSEKYACSSSLIFLDDNLCSPSSVCGTFFMEHVIFVCDAL